MRLKGERKLKILKDIKGGLIVSCQARQGWPMYGKEIMAAFSKAAMIGGAIGIRANGAENIREIKETTDLPVIGINKIWKEEYPVYITPTFKSAIEIIDAGADIIALDGTNRTRPDNETFQDIVVNIKNRYPDILIMADISNVEEGIYSQEVGVDLIATTLSGYINSNEGKQNNPDYELIKKLSKNVNTPIIAEGRISTPEEAKKCINYGAYAIVVGTAITRPEIITKKFYLNIQNINTQH